MPLFVLPGSNPGLLVRGNIDIDARSFVAVPVGNGKFASVQTVSWHVEADELARYGVRRPQGGEVLVPTVIRMGNKWGIISARGALDHYFKTGRMLGIFDTPAHATSYARRLHLQQEAAGRKRRQRAGTR